MALLELSGDTPNVTSQEAGDDTQQRPVAPNSDAVAVARNAQMAADEAYARELMSQMEREHQAAYGRPLGTAPAPAARQDGHQWREEDLRYQPRQSRQHDGGNTQQDHAGQPDGRYKGQDELDQLAEQFNKLADSKLNKSCSRGQLTRIAYQPAKRPSIACWRKHRRSTQKCKVREPKGRPRSRSLLRQVPTRGQADQDSSLRPVKRSPAKRQSQATRCLRHGKVASNLMMSRRTCRTSTSTT